MSFVNSAYLEQYRAAAGEGAVIELKMRLLADKHPALQSLAHAQKLEEIETKIVAHFKDAVSDEEKRTLEQCRRLRNKILHCNFSIARKKLIELGEYSQTANVKKVDLTGLSAIEIPVKIREAVAGIPGTYEYVSAAPTTCPGSVFGWLIAAGDEGDLLAAVDAFQKAVAIVDRLASVSATDP